MLARDNDGKVQARRATNANMNTIDAAQNN
jgi:hypothetical protein